jgi:redox-sensitive bicupin YhaK (pirin superfamily)
MLEIRRSEDRGVAKFRGAGQPACVFFGEYKDPQHMGFGPLRVINEDSVQPGTAFGTPLTCLGPA